MLFHACDAVADSAVTFTRVDVDRYFVAFLRWSDLAAFRSTLRSTTSDRMFALRHISSNRILIADLPDCNAARIEELEGSQRVQTSTYEGAIWRILVVVVLRSVHDNINFYVSDSI